jgi:HAD superfamily hydrolase (TIGR01509 family)
MPAHFKTWQLVVKEMGSPLEGEALMNQLYGNGAELMNRIVPGRTFTEGEARAIVAEKEERYRTLYGNEITVLEGAREFLEQALQQKIPMGIGTASNQANIDFALDKLDLRRYLNAIVGADDVQLSKPHPETWLKLAAELNTPPEQCIVFEDAPKGVEAALAAGMKAVAITGHFSANDFGKYENILQIVPALNMLNIDELLYL